jgi:hypothetical protein
MAYLYSDDKAYRARISNVEFITGQRVQTSKDGDAMGMNVECRGAEGVDKIADSDLEVSFSRWLCLHGKTKYLC